MISYEKILQRMLDRVSDKMDKREGSIIYDALAPAAMEMMLMYLELEKNLQETFGDTASRKYLIKRAMERGIKPTSASYAILKGVFNIDVEIGSRFSCNDLNYIVIEKIKDKEFKMQCEVIGVVGNKNFGNLIPIDYIEGLESAQLTELLIPGEDEEDTEIFRKRYLDSFDSQAFGGNKADYIEKTNSISGVGACKVYPAWNGGGTVKLVILNSEFETPSTELMNLVQTRIDPVTNHGEGIGLAPIGHTVTVEGAANTKINVKSTFTFVEGYDFSSSLKSIENAIDEYFSELRKTWQDENSIIVRISQIETRILSLPQILDIEGTTINNADKNIILESNQVPIRGDINNVN